MLILWTYAKGAVCITSSSDGDRVKRMAATERVRDLSKEEVEQIDEAGRRIHFRHWVSRHLSHVVPLTSQTEHLTNEYPAPDLPSDV